MKILLVVACIIFGFLIGVFACSAVVARTGLIAKEVRLKYLECCKNNEFYNAQEQNDKYIEISNLNQMFIENILTIQEYRNNIKNIKFPR